MDEARLRTLVREIVARHLDRCGRTTARAGVGAEGTGHPSHARFSSLHSPEGAPPPPCVIEPAVTCSQCGYCESLGH